MINSEQWWNRVKNSPEQLIDWLKDQYHGEITASVRIIEQFSKFPLNEADAKIIYQIAKEESLHAAWVGELLIRRGVNPEVLNKTERYWDKTLIDINSIEDLAAIAHHAEHMRLERIRAIANDPMAPYDIVTVFKKILPMEIKHEQLFAQLSSPAVIEARRNNHEAGKIALGLIV